MMNRNKIGVRDSSASMDPNMTESSTIPLQTRRESIWKKKFILFIAFGIALILTASIPAVNILLKNKDTTDTPTTNITSTTSLVYTVPTTSTIVNTTSTASTVRATITTPTVNTTSGVPSVYTVATTSRSIITTLTEEHLLPSAHNYTSLKWTQNASTVAGGHGSGSKLNQLSKPYGIAIVDDDEHQMIYVTDHDNHRIMAWGFNSSEGQIVAGGNLQGTGIHQLSQPTDVIFDKKYDSLIICDKGNKRIVRWFRQKKTPEIIIPSVDCWSLAMDNDRNLYVSRYLEREIRRYTENDTNGTQLTIGYNNSIRFNEPAYIFVNENRSIYISDWGHHRVIKQMINVLSNSIVAGGNGFGKDDHKLTYPQGLFVDHMNNLYVVDGGNDRVMRWCKGCETGEKVVGGNGGGNQANQFNGPKDLAFDRKHNLYVVDRDNHRVQRFDVYVN
ncbi:unnamed protein product [Adineta ricciae]|uniref:Uncharacterized protein n=1 Tax=Adineta ricciae TaxID=249248 RepID=A0A814MA63_ADIRI|nr:unnamed protein product [Adineta ricciae]CAF1377750.1 unnamed protein product [Adineta ricciae]